jgi:hypothetical protein
MPIATDAKRTRLSNDLVGVAGVHFVAYRLSLRGLIVLPTIRNTAGIDLLVHDPRTNAQASVQVKTAQRFVSFWPTSRAGKCVKGPASYHVFLRWQSAKDTFEAFLESGDRVAGQVSANAEEYVRRGNKEFPFWQLPREESEKEKLRRAWIDWMPTLIASPREPLDAAVDSSSSSVAV